MSETTCTRNNPKKSLEPYFDYPWEMICNIGKYNWSMAVQIQFEKVDMAIKRIILIETGKGIMLNLLLTH